MTTEEWNEILPLTFIEYQDAARKTAIYRQSITEYVDTLGIQDSIKREDLIALLCKTYVLLGFAGEVGEICNKFKKIIRDDKGAIGREKMQDFLKETGDTTWYNSATITEFGGSFDGVAKSNIEKLTKRKENGTIQGSGDTR